jgi:hypothetical protein
MMFDDEYIPVSRSTPFRLSPSNGNAVNLMGERALGVTITESDMSITSRAILPSKKMLKVVTIW